MSKGKLYFQAGIDNDQLRRDALESRKILDKIGDKAEIEGKRIDTMFKKAGVAVGTFFATDKIAQFGREIINVRSKIESFEISLQTLLKGDKNAADAMIGSLKEIAASSPLLIDSLAQGAQTMLGFNIEANKVVPVIKQIGDISMGDSEKFNSLVLAFSQMSSTGKLMGQDLLQMINAGFNPLVEISKRTGESIATLKEEMSKGAISVQMVEDAFRDATSEGGLFYGMLEKQGEGIKGAKAVFEGAVMDAMNDFAAANDGMIKGGYELATEMVKNYETIGAALVTLIATVGIHKGAMIAQSAFYKSVNKIKYVTETVAEGKAIEQLASAEIKEQVAKQGLKKASVEYYAAITKETQANLRAMEVSLEKSRTEVASANKVLTAKKEEYIAAKKLDKERLGELIHAKKTGNAKQIEAAQRKLNAAQVKKESAAISYQAASRDFNTKKTALESAAKDFNTKKTIIDTGVQNKNTASKKIEAAQRKLNAAQVKKESAAISYQAASRDFNAKKTALESAAKDFNTKKTIIDTGVQNKNTASKKLGAAASGLLSESMKKLSAVISANIWSIVAIGIATITYGLYRLATAASAAEIATNALNEAQKKHAEEIDNERSEIEKLLGELKNETLTRRERQSILNDLQQKYPKIFKNLDIEKSKYIDVANAIKLINKELEEKGKTTIKNDIKEAEDLLKSFTYGGRSEASPKIHELLNLSFFDKMTMSDAKLERALRVYISGMKGQLREIQEEEAQVKFNALSNRKKIEILEEKKKWVQQVNKITDGTNPDLIPEDAAKEIAKIEAQIKNLKISIEAETAALTTGGEEISKYVKQLRGFEKERAKIENSKMSETKRDEDLKKIDEKIKNTKAAITLRNKNYFKKNKKEAYNAALEIEQARINAMKDGYDKEVAIAELTHKKRLVNIKKKSKQLSKDEKEQLELYSADLLKIDLTKAKQKEEKRVKAKQKRLQDEKDKELAIEIEYLKKYGEIGEQKLAISREYEKKISDSKSEWAKKMLQKERDSKLQELDFEGFKRGIDFEKVFSNIDDQNTEALKVLNEKLAAYISSAADKLTPEQLKALSDAVTKIDITIRNRNPFKAVISGVKNYKASLIELKKAKKEGLNEEELNEHVNSTKDALQGLAGDINKVSVAISDYSSSIKGLLSSLGANELAESVGDVVGVLTGGLQSGVGVAKLMAGDISGVKDLAKGVSDVVSGIIRMGDKKHEKRIQRLQGNIDELGHAYDILGGKIQKAYSTDAANMIKQSNEMLKKQQELLRQQISEEKSKKKTNWDNVRGMEKKIKELNDQIASNQEKAIDAIFGEDVQTAIQSFADAYIAAWESGEDRAKTSSDIVKKMIKGMIIESMKMSIAGSGFMEKFRAKMQEFMKNDEKKLFSFKLFGTTHTVTDPGTGTIDENEQAILKGMVEDTMKQLDKKFGWMHNILEDDEKKISTKQGAASTGSYDKITQEQASSIDGRLTGIHIEVVGQSSSLDAISVGTSAITSYVNTVKERVEEVKGLSMLAVGHLEDISKNTHELYEMNERLGKIEKNTSKL